MTVKEAKEKQCKYIEIGRRLEKVYSHYVSDLCDQTSAMFDRYGENAKICGEDFQIIKKLLEDEVYRIENLEVEE